MDKISCKNCIAWDVCNFHSLTDKEINLLDEFKSTVSLERGGILNQQGQPATDIYCLQSGHAKIIWPDKNFQKESIVKIVSSGDMTGYRCVFSESTFRATAVALEPLKACIIPKKIFFELLRSNIDFNFEILKKMGIEIRKSEQRLHSYCTKNVRERLAECLIQLIDNGGIKNPDDTYLLNIKLTRDELSSLVGVAKETVVRALSDLKEENIISKEDHSLVILDLERLKKIASNIYVSRPIY